MQFGTIDLDVAQQIYNLTYINLEAPTNNQFTKIFINIKASSRRKVN